MKKVIIAVSLVLAATSANATTKFVKPTDASACIMIAAVAGNDVAMAKALALSYNKKEAIAAAKRSMSYLNAATPELRQKAFKALENACAKIGVEL
jgi:hypothetical protein